MNAPTPRNTGKPETPSRAQAVELLLRHAACPATLERAPWDAVGCVAAESVHAPAGIPECAVSLRDGYALRAQDTALAEPAHPLRLASQGRLTADSRNPAPLAPGRAVRILTGAPLPPGANAVIPLEQLAKISDPNSESIYLDTPMQAGSFILAQGGDLPAGSLLARAGERLTPQACAVLTRARVETLRVRPRPACAMFGLGSELAAPALHGDPERIPADNVVLATNLLRGWGADVQRCGVLPDDRAVIAAALRAVAMPAPDPAAQAAQRPALIVTTGGTGRSERDYARRAAEDAGFAPLFHGLEIRPGKNAFAALRSDPGLPPVLLLGLPGPPAAVFACLHALALPLTQFLQGLAATADLQAALQEGLRTRSGCEWLLPCSLTLSAGKIRAVALHGEEWPSLKALAQARAVIVLPPDSELPAGSLVELLCSAPF